MELLTFVREQMTDDYSWLPFKLRLGGGSVLTIDEGDLSNKQNLIELGLVPGATVTLMLSEDIRSELPHNAVLLKDIS